MIIVPKPRVRKKGTRSSPADSFARLVRYMVSGKSTERCTWISSANIGVWDGPDDVERAIACVRAVQGLNTRAKQSKTYHLVISFDPRDRRLTERELHRVVSTAVDAIGFSEHQHIAVRHSDQEHEHLHVAVNKIHPRTLKIHSPWRDTPTLMALADRLEHELGLHVVENRKARSHDLGPRARDYEGHTGVQSFERWAKRHVANNVDLGELRSWSDMHDMLATHGLRIIQRGNGLAVVDAERPNLATKASALGREWSKGLLSKRFGEFAPGPSAEQVIERRRTRYEALPLRTVRDGLWEEYQEALEKARGTRGDRREHPSGVRKRSGRMGDGYSLRHAVVRALPVSGRDQFHLHRLIELERRARRAGARKIPGVRDETHRVPHPGSWLEFLSTRASEGDPRATRRLEPDSALPRLSGRGRCTETQLPHACFRTSKGSRVHILPSGRRLFETRRAIRFPTDSDEQTFVCALELAKHKFGDRVTLHADPHLRRRLSHLCEARGIHIESSSRQRTE